MEKEREGGAIHEKWRRKKKERRERRIKEVEKRRDGK